MKVDEMNVNLLAPVYLAYVPVALPIQGIVIVDVGVNNLK